MQSLWMLVASFGFSLMGVAVKLASETYSTAEIVMFRGLTGVVMLFSLLRWQGGSLRTRFGWQHLWRGMVGVASLWLWFYAIGKMPLATAMTLNYMSPVWMALLIFIGALRRGQAGFPWGLLAAILCSALGVVLVLRPAFHADQWHAGLMALLSSLLAAFAYLAVRDLGRRGEPETRVVFYFSLSGAVAGLLSMQATPGVTLWHAHTLRGFGLLLAVGVLATLAQIAMTRAYRLGNTLVTANLQYTGIVFSSLWGILLWQDQLGLWSWLGMGLILLSGISATYYNTRSAAAQNTPGVPPDPIASEP